MFTATCHCHLVQRADIEGPAAQHTRSGWRVGTQRAACGLHNSGRELRCRRHTAPLRPALLAAGQAAAQKQLSPPEADAASPRQVVTDVHLVHHAPHIVRLQVAAAGKPLGHALHRKPAPPRATRWCGGWAGAQEQPCAPTWEPLMCSSSQQLPVGMHCSSPAGQRTPAAAANHPPAAARLTARPSRGAPPRARCQRCRCPAAPPARTCPQTQRRSQTR